jgi:hypothetical protein
MENNVNGAMLIEQALRMGLRYPLAGNVSTEDLFKAKIKLTDAEIKRGVSAPNLYDLEDELTKKISEIPRRRRETPTSEEQRLKIMLDVVSYIISKREEEEKEAAQRAENARAKKETMELLAQIKQERQMAAYKNMTDEEFKKLEEALSK